MPTRALFELSLFVIGVKDQRRCDCFKRKSVDMQDGWGGSSVVITSCCGTKKKKERSISITS